MDIFDKAFKVLRRNYGCPGMDGVSLQAVKKNYAYHKALVVAMYNNQQINSLPIKAKTIIDYGTHKRSIFIYCLYDKWIQMVIKLQVEPALESMLSDVVFAHRRGRDFNDLCKYLFKSDHGKFLYLDVLKYTDNINRKILIDSLRQNKKIRPSELNLVEKSFSHAEVGLPQGNVLTPILSNTYLCPIDNEFSNLRYARFGDNLYFLLDNDRHMYNIIEAVKSSLSRLGLKLNHTKTEIEDVARIRENLNS